MKVFFAHPHSPWHKPIIEHANKLFRRFIPKGSDILSLTQEQLDIYVHILNNKPRKRLNYLTPTQVFLNPKLLCILK
jgi:IS30 family transposase